MENQCIIGYVHLGVNVTIELVGTYMIIRTHLYTVSYPTTQMYNIEPPMHRSVNNNTLYCINYHLNGYHVVCS